VILRAASLRPPTPVLAAHPLSLLALLALASCAATTAPKGARSPHDVRADDARPPSPRPVAKAPKAAVTPRSRPFTPSATPPATGPVYQRGLATYYADKFNGRPTATGEPYDPALLTAAHRTLPLGAVVDVARPDGRHVTVRINDRGPYGKGRVIDLSYRAAVEIGLLDEGITRVLLRVVSMPEKPAKPRRRRR
jgi:rare lipoprotein A